MGSGVCVQSGMCSLLGVHERVRWGTPIAISFSSQTKVGGRLYKYLNTGLTVESSADEDNVRETDPT